MYKIILNENVNRYHCEELIKIFLRPDQFQIDYVPGVISDDEGEAGADAVINLASASLAEADKDTLKRELFRRLSEKTGRCHEWGILTGVRPVKLAGELVRKFGGEEAAAQILREKYLLSEEKKDLILSIYRYQQEQLSMPPARSVGIYLGIPFCPTRCVYCAFTSNQAKPEEIERYLKALHHEIDGTAALMKNRNLYPESIYIGGGTPTTLTAGQLDELMAHINEAFDISGLREFTVEAGRPDTIDTEKLLVIRNRGAERISINPQSMKDETLEIIGRSHKASDICRAFEQAKSVGIPYINADVIAGLSGEDEEDFGQTLEQIISMGADNITVHTLAVKRASKLVELDKDFHYKQAETVKRQLERGRAILAENGYRPYYLYRQKNMAGGLENAGYCKNDTVSVYNVRIMEEMQTIIALGAGGISKVYYPSENRLERAANVSNYQIYIDRIDEMIERKEKIIFQEEKTIC